MSPTERYFAGVNDKAPFISTVRISDSSPTHTNPNEDGAKLNGAKLKFPYGIKPNGMKLKFEYGTNENGGTKPNGENPNGVNPNGLKPKGVKPKGVKPKGVKPKGVKPNGLKPKGTKLKVVVTEFDEPDAP